MPVIQLKKVNRAVKAFDKVDAIKERERIVTEAFLDAYEKLNDAEKKEFSMLTGVTIGKSHPKKEVKV